MNHFQPHNQIRHEPLRSQSVSTRNAMLKIRNQVTCFSNFFNCCFICFCEWIFLLFLSCLLVSVDDTSYLFGFFANDGYWWITHFIVVRYLILILLIIGLLFNFLVFFFICFVVLSVFVFWFLFFPWSYYFVCAEEERWLFSQNIHFVCFFQYSCLALIPPFLILYIKSSSGMRGYIVYANWAALLIFYLLIPANSGVSNKQNRL